MFTGKVKAFTEITADISQRYYPEILNKMFIINSGYIFKGIWLIIRNWIDQKTQKKIHIIAGSGRKELLKYINPESLPSFLGGDCQDELTNDVGPWHDELVKSYKNQTVYHSDPLLF